MWVEIDHGEASDTPIPSLSASAGTVRLNAIRLASLEMVHRGLWLCVRKHDEELAGSGVVHRRVEEQTLSRFIDWSGRMGIMDKLGYVKQTMVVFLIL